MAEISATVFRRCSHASAGKTLKQDEESKMNIRHYNGDNKSNLVVDTSDNWISEFLYSGRIGLTLNFTVLTSITLHFALTIGAKLRDEYFYEEIFKQIWLRQFLQLCFFFAPISMLYYALLALVVFPLSRLSRSTAYYWFIGVSISSLMFAMLFTNHLFGIETMFLIRLIAGFEWARMSMKMTSFLVECNRNKETFDKCSLRTLSYFYFIPHLIYKQEYPRARRVRWIKVVSHIWWFLAALMPLQAIILPVVPYLIVNVPNMSLTVALMGTLTFSVFFTIFYMIGIQFAIFETYCGVHGEITRFPELKLFGTFLDLFNGTRAPAEMNLIVSNWLKIYIYTPAREATNSRFKALLFTFTLSDFFHDLVSAYIFGFSLVHIAIISAIVQASMMDIKAASKFWKILQSWLFYVSYGIWYSLFVIEFLLRNYSSIPNAQNVSPFRLVPLFVDWLQMNH